MSNFKLKLAPMAPTVDPPVGLASRLKRRAVAAAGLYPSTVTGTLHLRPIIQSTIPRSQFSLHRIPLQRRYGSLEGLPFG